MPLSPHPPLKTRS
jgi:DNA ligase-1